MAFCDNNRFYRSSFIAYGQGPKALHWVNTHNQFLRFSVLFQGIQKPLKDTTIVDAGCGLGDLYLYILQENIMIKQYIGIDCEFFMVAGSKKRFPSQKFVCLNILQEPNLPKADYYVCSGGMNILSDKEVFVFIQQCFDACQVGFVFNFYTQLSFNTITQKDIIQYCEKLASNFKVLQGYLEHDFTIVMLK